MNGHVVILLKEVNSLLQPVVPYLFKQDLFVDRPLGLIPDAFVTVLYQFLQFELCCLVGDLTFIETCRLLGFETSPFERFLNNGESRETGMTVSEVKGSYFFDL